MGKKSEIDELQGELTRPLPIVFDTSILRGLRLSNLASEFRLLQRLAHAKKVALFVPQMAAREWLSQRIEQSSGILDRLQDAMNELKQQPSLAEQTEGVNLIKSDLHSSSAIQKLRNGSSHWHERQLNKLGFNLIELHPNDLATVLDGYFAGQPPFANKKARNDLPDAFVLAGVIRLFKSDERAIFVCNDARLRDAAHNSGVTVASTLAELLKHRTISSLHTNVEFAIWWEQNFATFLADVQSNEKELENLIADDLASGIFNAKIWHQSIPEDNHEASIIEASDISDLKIHWEKAESLGEGLLTVPILFEAEIELEFFVYRTDAFHVSDWVNVRYGDLENDHYFQASGSRRARYRARLVIDFGESIIKNNIAIDRLNVTIEDAEFSDFVDGLT